MKKTPTITKEALDQFGSDLNQFIATGDWPEMIPKTESILQEIVDSLSSEDAETALAAIDHHLEYKPSEFKFAFKTDHVGPSADSKYTCTLEIGDKKHPYVITVVSRP